MKNILYYIILPSFLTLCLYAGVAAMDRADLNSAQHQALNKIFLKD